MLPILCNHKLEMKETALSKASVLDIAESFPAQYLPVITKSLTYALFYISYFLKKKTDVQYSPPNVDPKWQKMAKKNPKTVLF